MNRLLEVQGLSVALPVDGSERQILRDVSLSIGVGEAVGLVGESGSGKSMTARAVARILPHGAKVSGEVAFEGESVRAMSRAALRAYRQHGVSMLFQDSRAAINPVHTIGDFLTEALRTQGHIPAAEASRLAVAALADVGINDGERRLNQYPHQMSGGMLQRAMITAALLAGTKLIIADEPTTAVDVTTQSEVMAILNDLRRQRGLGLLFISHDLALAMAICDRIYVMYAGTIVESQRATDIGAHPAHPYTQALFAARPSIDSASRRLPAIPGRPLAAYEVPHGCVFANRCLFVQPACQESNPELTAHAGGFVRCRRAEDISGWGLRTPQIPHAAGAPTGSPHVANSSLGRNAEPIVEAVGLRKVFRLPRGSGHQRQHVAVDDVSFEVARGGALAVVGESGSGKTTMARMLIGLERPTAGRMFVAGRDRSRPPRRSEDRRRRGREMQIVFQDPYGSLDPRQSGAACLDEVLRLHFRMSRAARAARVEELGEQVGLGKNELQSLPQRLSGGQRQRLAIARALAATPAVLVLDEPVSALDVSVQAQVLNLLVDIRERTGITYVFVSHDLAVVRQVTDEAIVMQHGRIVERGSTAAILDAPQHPYTRELRDSVPGPGWRPRRRPR